MSEESKKVREILDNLQPAVAKLTPRELLRENKDALLAAREKRVTPKQIADALTSGGVKITEGAVVSALREFSKKSKPVSKLVKKAVKRKASDNVITKKTGGD